MKRNIITPIVTLVIIITVCIVNIIFVNKAIKKINHSIYETITAVNNNDYTSASDKLEIFEKEYDKFIDYLHISVRHSELDEIKDLKERAIGYFSQQEYDLFIAEFKVLVSLFEHIFIIECPTIENIL